jgi:hypothetical protein
MLWQNALSVWRDANRYGVKGFLRLGAAAGAGVAYWALHNRPSVVGCVQRSDQGNAIFNEKDGKLYHLLPDNPCGGIRRLTPQRRC